MHKKSEKDTVLSKKEIRQAEMEMQYELTNHMLENKSFALEADFLLDKYGNRVFANSNINFVSVNSATAVIQVGSDFHVGYNGVGGVTAKGLITKYDLKENERRKTFDLNLSVMTALGIYDLRFSNSPSTSTRATLTGLRRG